MLSDVEQVETLGAIFAAGLVSVELIVFVMLRAAAPAFSRKDVPAPFWAILLTPAIAYAGLVADLALQGDVMALRVSVPVPLVCWTFAPALLLVASRRRAGER